MIKKIFILSILCLELFALDRKSSEAKCSELVAIEETAWSKLVDNINKVGWNKSIPEIRNWDEKQIKARDYCIEKDGHLYEDIIILNKRVREFRDAGGFKINY